MHFIERALFMIIFSILTKVIKIILDNIPDKGKTKENYYHYNAKLKIFVRNESKFFKKCEKIYIKNFN